MRYAEGGGVTAEERKRREWARMEAAQRFERGEKTARVAAELRVSVRSVKRWPRTVREAGVARTAMKKIRYRARLIDGCLADTGLIMHPA